MSFCQNWPETLRPTIASVYKRATASAQPSIVISVRKYGAWATKTHGAITISSEHLHAFNRFLRQRICRKTANWQTRHIYTIGTRSPDKAVRDHLFESHIDKRTADEILNEKWWPSAGRALAAGADFADKRRVLLELDNYFRCRDRIGRGEEALQLSQLFLKDGVSDRTRYQRLSRLCIGLETVAPHEADHIALREAQLVLYSVVWPPARRAPRGARPISEVEKLLAAYLNPKTGDPYAPASIQSRRKSLNLLHGILTAANRPFDFSKTSLDLFADFAFAKNDTWLDPTSQGGWCRRSTATHIMNLAPFIPESGLRQEWNAYGQHFARLARIKGDVKMKERALAERPMNLADFFATANLLIRQAEVTKNSQSRHGMSIVVGALGILLFYPLRKSDLLRIRIGEHLKRDASNWFLDLGHTQKTNTPTEPLKLPKEATPLLDASILRGAPRDQIHTLYHRRYGQPLLKSPRRQEGYHPGAFSTLFSRWTGHSPHILRSVWCDEMVSQSKDRLIISIMLQHTSLISQKDYEILAAKIRGKLAAQILRGIANDIEDD